MCGKAEKSSIGMCFVSGEVLNRWLMSRPSIPGRKTSNKISCGALFLRASLALCQSVKVDTSKDLLLAMFLRP